jgi:outer membrane receptor protein involved in Fe transport
MVQYATLAGAFQPRNVGDGQVIGTEIEFRLNLEPLIKALRNVAVSSNITFAKSLIRLSNTEYQSRTENARTGQTIDEYRDMAGQAPFILNFGVSYNGGVKGFWNGFEAGLYYNVQGQTLQYVGMVDRPDIYSKPFHSLNFNSNKSFGVDKRLQIGLKVENLLNDTKESVFKAYEANDQYFTRLYQGITFQLKLSYSFF